MASRIPLGEISYPFAAAGSKADRQEMTGPADFIAFRSISSAALLTSPGVSALTMQVQLFADNDANGSLIITMTPGDVLRVPHNKAVIINPNAGAVTAKFTRGAGSFQAAAGFVKQDKADSLLVTERPLADGANYTLFQDLVGAGATTIVAAGANPNGIIVASGRGWCKGTGAAFGQAALWATDGAHALELVGAYSGILATEFGSDAMAHEWLLPQGTALVAVTSLGSILSCSYRVL
jgi:hypothetical protein